MNKSKPIKEGFLQTERYIIKEGPDVFDDFYAEYYDELTFSHFRNIFEIGEIITLSNLTSHSKVLDIGSGTGHHVALLAEHHIPVIGLDSSRSMINYSKKTYPNLNFRLGSVLDKGIYPANSFTHILSLYYTIYYIDDKKKFFENCVRWLMPGGYLVIHLVDKKNFNPIMPNGMVDFSQKLGATNKYTKTVMVLRDHSYTSNLIQDQNEPDIFMLKEKFTDKDNMVRENQHTLYMNTQKHILGLAKQEGFIMLGQIDMSPIQYDYQYIYILQKPN
ncbi:MAG: class I SAM-dependent methyltransferase [Candidatus Thorarchaeota archaeon]|jgi:ubiquinone/menaquinone biosynthesis C-methylase UbiE